MGLVSGETLLGSVVTFVAFAAVGSLVTQAGYCMGRADALPRPGSKPDEGE